MSPIQQMLLGVGAVATKTYVDDVFSTFLYKGTSVTNGGPAQTINNGIDVSGKGGLVWIKTRNGSLSNALFDTVRGKTKRIKTNSSDAENTSTSYLADFKTNGFEVGTSASTNSSDGTFSSWTFRKAPGFFTCLTYVGSGSNRTISHDLSCVPGMIIIKRTDTASDWRVYHRGSGATKYLTLNENYAAGTHSSYWQDTAPTASVFSLGTDGDINASGGTYVCYLFGGGESTQNEAVSVDFDGSSDYLSLAPHSDLAFGTGDFTIEFWMKMSTKQYTIFFDMRPSPETTQGSYPCIYYNANSSHLGYSTNSADQITGPDLEAGQWYHVALSRSGTSTKMFLNGTQVGSTYSDSSDYLNGDTTIGCRADTTTGDLDGYISNFRCVKGTAVYTSSFKPPTEPLTNITNTKLLCCNDSSTTGSTVTPGTITATGTVTASTDSPFDDPAGFVFGDSKEGIIKCGSFVGNGNADGPEINLGWEPSWILLKNATASSRDWKIVDAMRGIVTGGDDASLRPNESNGEDDESVIDLTPTGFKLTASNAHYNENGETIVFCVIRRPDGYVGKPVELGTGVFAINTGAGSGVNPTFDSNFAVDMGIMRQPASTQNWFQSARITGDNYMYIDTNAASTSGGGGGPLFEYDYSKGWCNSNAVGSSGANYQSWMWKRSNSFTTVAYKGNGVAGRQIAHDMNNSVDMLWVKTRDSTENWIVGHKGLNGGSSPWDYEIALNSSAQEGNNINKWNDTAPTSSHFTLGNGDAVNKDGDDYIAMLFSSISGISAVGSYSGNGSSTARNFNLGFQPRFIIIKGATNTAWWQVLDTTRGWGPGNDELIWLNDSAAQMNFNTDWGAPTSTGFTFSTTDNKFNQNNINYIYYAHA